VLLLSVIVLALFSVVVVLLSLLMHFAFIGGCKILTFISSLSIQVCVRLLFPLVISAESQSRSASGCSDEDYSCVFVYIWVACDCLRY
jgi:hypothetical protein